MPCSTWLKQEIGIEKYRKYVTKSLLESNKRSGKEDVKHPKKESRLHGIGNSDTKHASQRVHEGIGGKWGSGYDD